MNDRLTFTKMQGVGNDFVVIDAHKYTNIDWSAFAIEMCDRHLGIGADGLLILESSRYADIQMRMYNPDGSPDVCGNGLRCVARYAFEHHLVETETMDIHTLAGVRRAIISRDSHSEIAAVTVSMGQPIFEPARIPMRVTREPALDFPLELPDGTSITLSALSTGSTHAVTFVPAMPSETEFQTISPMVENHPLFPDRTSLMWCVPKGENRIQLRIWERGAGETWGCGTGACAAAVAALLKGCVEQNRPVEVESIGGTLTVSWRPGEDIEMTGPAENVYEGVYCIN